MWGSCILCKKLRFNVKRLSGRSHLMRLGLHQNMADIPRREYSIDDRAKSLIFKVSEHRRQLVGNAGCIIYAYGVICTILLLGRVMVLFFLVVNPICCGSNHSHGCFNMNAHIFLLLFLGEWTPEIVPTLLMLHLMWYPANGKRTVNLKSMRLRSLVQYGYTTKRSA